MRNYELIFAMRDAAKSGDMVKLSELYSEHGWPLPTGDDGKGVEYVSSDIAICGESSSIAVAEWLRINGCPWGERDCEKAYFGENYELLAWLRDPDTGGGQCFMGARVSDNLAGKQLARCVERMKNLEK